MKVFFILLIIILGTIFRIDDFNKNHPDIDELFQIKNMQESKPFWRNDQMYGDHTSYPLEYLIHFAIIKVLPHLSIDLEKNTVEGYRPFYKWILAIPHLIFYVMGLIVFYVLCEIYLKSTQAKICAFILLMFNVHLIYHAFAFRPYSVLIGLGIINLESSLRFFTMRSLRIIPIMIFSCFYHAYGLLIVLVCLVFNYFYAKTLFYGNAVKWRWMFLGLCVSSSLWAYYASWNSFGLHPNKIQSIVDPFQFMSKQNLFENLLLNFFGNQLLYIIFLPLTALGIIFSNKKQLFFLLILIIVPSILIILFDIKTQYWIHSRQFVWIMPFWAVFCGMMIDNLKEKAVTN